MGKATVRLQLADTDGNPLVDPNVVAEFTNIDATKNYRVSFEATGSVNIDVTLPNPGIGVYKVTLIPVRYRMLQFFLRVQEDTITERAPLVFPVNPSKVTGIRAPDFDALPEGVQTMLSEAALPNFPAQGAELYQTLSAPLKAALLNFYVKSSATGLADNETVFPLLGAPMMLHQDRIFCKITAHLVEETMVSSNFHQVPYSLHANVPPYLLFDSYKTKDDTGNLQLTFSRNGNSGDDYLVDMDIDEAQGFEHIFEVIHNETMKSLTSPYTVREILLVGQDLKPLYTFEFAEAASAQAG